MTGNDLRKQFLDKMKPLDKEIEAMFTEKMRARVIQSEMMHKLRLVAFEHNKQAVNFNEFKFVLDYLQLPKAGMLELISILRFFTREYGWLALNEIFKNHPHKKELDDVVPKLISRQLSSGDGVKIEELSVDLRQYSVGRTIFTEAKTEEGRKEILDVVLKWANGKKSLPIEYVETKYLVAVHLDNSRS
jgi:hypothetical protein